MCYTSGTGHLPVESWKLFLCKFKVSNGVVFFSKGFGDFGAGGMTAGGHRYVGDGAGILGLYSKGGVGMDGSWTRGSSYSDIRSVGFHRNDPVYEEIEKPNHMSPRASVSDLSEDEGQIYPHELDIYHRNIYGQQVRKFIMKNR